MATEYKVLDGSDLLLNINGIPLGYSTTCKITTSAETAERVTKEISFGKWKQAFVKTISETITADGLILINSDADKPTYKQLKDLMLAGEPVVAYYGQRLSTGSDKISYYGNFIITKLDADGTAGEDAKYSIELQNYGAIQFGQSTTTSE